MSRPIALALAALLAALLGALGCEAAPVEPYRPVLCGGEGGEGGAGGPCVDVRVIAHPDDDLLFMNPDLATSLAAGNRVVTVVVTAGTPSDPARLTGRELGLLNAYAFMAGPEHAVTEPDDAPAMLARWRLHGGQPIAVADAAGGTRHAIQYDFAPPLPAGGALSLVFLRVVEENGVDLAALLRGEVTEIPTVACEAGCLFGASLASQAYGREQLVGTLEALLERFADRALPGGLAVSTLDATKLFHRQVAYGLGWVDHADHLAVAELAVAAFLRHHRRSHTTPRTLHQYRAYNTGREPPNLGETDGEPREKRRAFYRYFALGEGLAGQDDDGRPREYTNRDPDDPHFHIATYEAWSERRYVLSSLPPVQGRLAAGEPPRCLHASGDAAALGPCDGAPVWEAIGGALRLLPDGAACLALDANANADGDLARVAPCAPATPADGEARAFVPTGTGQIRTRGGGCLQADTTGVASADCAKRVDGDGDPTRHPIAAQAWSWLPL